jgi:two-component system LytT family sensor kinase
VAARGDLQKRGLLVCAAAVAIVAAASQWSLYDSIHGHAERFTYYLITCAYLCGVLAPAAIWMGRRWPIDSTSWKMAIPAHVAASLLLTALGISIEAVIGWAPHSAGWPLPDALRHYFSHHTQISILAYWTLLGGLHIFRMYDRSRLRDLQNARLEAELRDAQLAALRMQLQPHFLFNTLQATTVMIYDDPEGAEEVLLSLSELLRISLDALRHQEVPLEQEIEFVKHYTSIQQRRFDNRLRFDFSIEPAAALCAAPSLLLQPLVENAIRHGVGKHREADTVSIRAVVRNDRLHLEVRNLASVLEDAPENLLSRGVGLANTCARLEKLYGKRQSFEIRNLEPRGVLVSISIPQHFVAADDEVSIGEALV